jgi:hypothetical protein
MFSNKTRRLQLRSYQEEVTLPASVRVQTEEKARELERRQNDARILMGKQSLLAVPLNEDPLWAHRFPKR